MPWTEGQTKTANVPVASDSMIIAALQKAQIWDVVRAKGGLDAEMDADFLSHGQRQLFCLARSILRSSKVVILDEVSSRYANSTSPTRLP